MPDEKLLRLADQRKLRDPAVLSAQVRRMIQDRRAWMFIEQFAEQWLELDRLQRVTVHKSSYPDFDDQLASAMRLETIHFFGEVLRGDLSIFQFLASDFTCVNETLAAHYGIAGVAGPQFRKVKLDERHHRGGVLTHASILTGLSDGKDGHPIKRGIWLLRNLLDEPPPPPPPNVPELNRDNPDVKNLTIPQALAFHRNSAACMGCHRKIDPWGIAFEEYDAVGNWQRDGIGATLRKRRTAQPIDARAELPTGVKVDGMQELREELLRSKSDDVSSGDAPQGDGLRPGPVAHARRRRSGRRSGAGPAYTRGPTAGPHRVDCGERTVSVEVTKDNPAMPRGLLAS